MVDKFIGTLRVMSLSFLAGIVLLSTVSAAHAAPFTFLVFGDNRGNDEVYSDLITKANQEQGISFGIAAGDLVPAGLQSEYQHYMKLESRFKFKVYHVIGNHDTVNGGGERFEKYLGPRYYSFDYEGYHFVMIDNAGWRGLGKTQWDWLQRDLDAHKSFPMFVFMHKPLTDVSGFYVNHVFTPEREAVRLARTLKNYYIQMVFGGHIHGYARGMSYGLPEIITAGAGAPLYMPYSAGGFYHYIRVCVGDSAKNIAYDVVKLYEE